MKLQQVYIRFYRCFNFDYLRKSHRDAVQLPWETTDGLWYPYVEVAVEPAITTVVGANESGKSHLLDAIEKASTGKKIEHQDICRYSHHFTVDNEHSAWPHFGLHFTDLTVEEQNGLRACIPGAPPGDLREFWLFREDPNILKIFTFSHGEYSRYDVDGGDAEKITELLPRTFRIKADVALPATVPLSWLVHRHGGGDASPLANVGRRDRRRLSDYFLATMDKLSNVQLLRQHADEIAPEAEALRPNQASAADLSRQYELVNTLLTTVAGIRPEMYNHIREGLEREDEGYVNGLVMKINAKLEEVLNFPNWWIQDKDFRLVVTMREGELAFTIRDRTGTEYCFGERSAGLRYFLSYYIQYKAHKGDPSQSELLLLDEPDAYLSVQGQQDLLKILEAYTDPANTGSKVQVIYVTHSPCLINRNHAERIRVLEKGRLDEGTRVVRDASRNHYEPLRSSIGAYAGELAFIGNANLVVEGLSDQMLIAGISMALTQLGVSRFQNLDLNHITIVPAGSASHIPYLVYLARGRDIEKPAVMVLLDGDEAGADARRLLVKDPVRNRGRLLDPAYIRTIPELAAAVHRYDSSLGCGVAEAFVELMDFTPPRVLMLAVQRYLEQIGEAEEAVVRQYTLEAFQNTPNSDAAPLWTTLESLITRLQHSHHLDKAGLARNIVDILREEVHERVVADLDDDIQQFVLRMKAVFSELRTMQVAAEEQTTQERVRDRLNRERHRFIADHPAKALRGDAADLFGRIDTIIGDSDEADAIRAAMSRLRREFALDQEPGDEITELGRFCAGLEEIRYASLNAVQQPDGTVPAVSAATELAPAEVPNTEIAAADVGDDVAESTSGEAEPLKG